MIGNWSADATIDANVSRREKTKTKSQIKWINVKMYFGRNFSLIELWIKCLHVYVCKCNVYLSKRSIFFFNNILMHCKLNPKLLLKSRRQIFLVYAVVYKAHSLWKWRKMLAFNQLINLSIEHFNVFDSPDFCSFFYKIFLSWKSTKILLLIVSTRHQYSVTFGRIIECVASTWG